jgi:hypothetical protein
MRVTGGREHQPALTFVRVIWRVATPQVLCAIPNSIIGALIFTSIDPLRGRESNF